MCFGVECPKVDALSDTSLRDLPPLSSEDTLSRVLNTVLLLHVTSTKHYSAHTRAFLLSIAPIDEQSAISTLKDPKHALEDAESHAKSAKDAQARKNRTWRALGVGGAALAGGVLVGVTGGLAAPLVGAGVSTLLGALGLGGSAAGVLAAGLASSSAVCGALFGVYGAKEGAEMIARHTKEVADFAIVPVREPRETLAVRICVSGWLGNRGDVTAPWTVFDESEDTFALQWEVEALEKLSTALGDLLKSNAIKLVRNEILKHTFLAALTAALAPIAFLKLGELVDNPWANTKNLAIKTGKVLASLLANRAFGARPVSLYGYSLGALVILSALDHLAGMYDDGEEKEMGMEKISHVVQDVYLMGTPIPSNSKTWTRARRVVSGHLVNAYTDAEADYVLAFLSRLSLPSSSSSSSSSTSKTAKPGFGVAGLEAVEISGVENVKIDGVEGHVAWRGMVGRCLEVCGARGLRKEEVERQEEEVGERIRRDIEEKQRGRTPESGEKDHNMV
ncbi:DUF726-domain-containing protein [Fomitiporia mediterranea MF3/22]|uniref:DUF726-domain-containing protein n=1 Tax=Fomitiporia mediterranea (strain MF3/22) TaxID=694068 RepID=UPI0004407750|nr:DUF726-domain-containing protein [Fomitiporia mediterranea MF3/22]EJD02454.1 DUF726-domain-containing protein [Fomitiporia mediterranea MF3/22]